MANALNEDLTNRYVILKAETMAPAYRDIPNRVFLVMDGFGAVPFTRGSALLGVSPIDGEKWQTDGWDVERFATDEEIALVTSYDPHGGAKHRDYEEN